LNESRIFDGSADGRAYSAWLCFSEIPILRTIARTVFFGQQPRRKV
jgi:hypothetical protein